MIVDVVLTVINVILAIISGFGAFKSVKYYRKSKSLTVYTKLSGAVDEIEKMIQKLPGVLGAVRKQRQGTKGFNMFRTIGEIGENLINSYNLISSAIPSDFAAEFREFETKEGFDLLQYLNSYVSGEAIGSNNDIDSLQYKTCQERLMQIQDFLKTKKNEAAENSIK